MKKLYELGKSPDGSYIYVRSIKQGVTLDLAVRFTDECTTLGEQSDLNRCLIDMRGTTSISSVSGKYEFAYNKAREVGLSHKWKMALLKDDGDTSPDFLQTVMDNAGWRFKLFVDNGLAEAWLKGA